MAKARTCNFPMASKVESECDSHSTTNVKVERSSSSMDQADKVVENLIHVQSRDTGIGRELETK